MEYVKFCVNIGLNIKYFRNKLNMTQEDLSEKIELATRYISDIERGKRNITLKTLFKIANALKISPDLLLKNPFKEIESDN